MRCFLSHNIADKDVARSLGAHMTLTGIDVWFDEWEIQAGDSVPGKLNKGSAHSIRLWCCGPPMRTDQTGCDRS